MAKEYVAAFKKLDRKEVLRLTAQSIPTSNLPAYFTQLVAWMSLVMLIIGGLIIGNDKNKISSLASQLDKFYAPNNSFSGVG